MLGDEVSLVVERVNGLLITEASLIRDIVSAIGAKKGSASSKAFGDSVKRLNMKSVARREIPPDA